MTIYRLVKVASAVAVLGFIGQVQADDGEIHGAVTIPTAHDAMMHDAMPVATPAVTSMPVHDAMDHGAMPVITSIVTGSKHHASTASGTPENLAKYVGKGAISGGMGINYVGRFTFDNTMAKFDLAKGLFGTELSVVTSPNGFPNFVGDKTAAEQIAIPPLRSMSWNNTQSNPDDKTTTDLTKGFGSALHSQWYLVDLSKLAAGTYYVSVKVERYDDGVATANEILTPAVLDTDGKTVKTPAVYATLSDDDLVPALTVFNGYQNRGAHLGWFPNQFQTTTTPFWAEMLKPEATLVGANTGKTGFDTAFGAADEGIAQVSGVMKLDSTAKGLKQSNRYLTVALGGDDRNAATKRDVNYKLTVKVHKK